MMLFEEFFKKKKIDLDTLQQGEPDLFLEFKDHYEQMGEKSFDHTKKYWFNKLRRQYPLAPEIKSEKSHLENPLAEQTISDTLTEPSHQEAAPQLSFKPESKTPIPSLTTTEPTADTAPVTDGNAQPTNPAATPAKVGFKPRFKPGITAVKPESETVNPEPIIENTEAPATPAKVGFKPRFKAGVTNTKTTEEVAAPKEETPLSATIASEDKVPEEPAPAKVDFKPRFKAGVTTAKPSGDLVKIPESINETEQPENINNVNTEKPEAEQAPAKLGFKPRFKAGVTNTKPAEESKDAEPIKEEKSSIDPTVEEAPKADDNLKPAYKPRFNPNMVKRKPADEE